MKALVLLVAVVVASLVAGAAFLYSGAYPVGADQPHWPATARLMATLRDRAVAAAARGIVPPANLGDPERVRRGAGNYEAMCAGCHLKPGMADAEIRRGLYPQPPDLATAAAADPARQFWIIKHGLKMTGMPAWSLGGMEDADIWDLVALLQRLPRLTPQDYAALVASSQGHAHAGIEPGHVDPPGAPPHHHE